MINEESMQDITYLLVDPIGRWDSGISSYTRNASKILTSHNIKSSIIVKNKDESIEEFRTRLAEYVEFLKDSGQKVFIEAPETKASTVNVSLEDAYIHIRLHCSLNLGALAEGRKVQWPIFFLEQAEIERAHRVSSPSMSSVIASQELFGFKREISCYPNPTPLWAPKSTEFRLEPGSNILFVGRWQVLKGVHFLVELAERLPEVNFMVVTILNEKLPKSLPKNISLVDGSNWNKKEVYKKASIVIIPSIYETASMVGLEAMSLGIPVIAWSHLGISEYAFAPTIMTISPWDIEAFSNEIALTLRDYNNLVIDSNIPQKVNDLFVQGVQKLVTGEVNNYMPVTLGNKDEMIIRSLVTNTNVIFRKIKITTSLKITNKFRKFRTNPKLFFRDSWLVKVIMKYGLFYKRRQKR